MDRSRYVLPFDEIIPTEGRSFSAALFFSYSQEVQAGIVRRRANAYYGPQPISTGSHDPLYLVRIKAAISRPISVERTSVRICNRPASYRYSFWKFLDPK